MLLFRPLEQLFTKGDQLDGLEFLFTFDMYIYFGAKSVLAYFAHSNDVIFEMT